jgi:YtkA-like
MRGARPRRRLAAVALAVALVAVAGLAALVARGGGESARLEGEAVESQRGVYRIAIAPQPSRAPVNRLHSWQVELLDSEGGAVTGASIAVDGDMPAHGHGLPTSPLARELGDGRYELEGMKFQMGGAWYVELRVAGRPGVDTARVEFVLPGG